MPRTSNRHGNDLTSRESISHAADRLAISVKELIRTAETEEDLRIGVEKSLSPLLRSIGVEPHPRYERLGARAKTVYRGRPDAVHGQVIIEYERPGALSSAHVVQHAYEQLVGYMTAEAYEKEPEAVSLLNRLVGVGFDGISILFVRYPKRTKTVHKSSFVRYGPYAFEKETARSFLTYLRALTRLPLTAENLADRFGPQSRIAPLAVSAFADALEHWADSRIRLFFDEWKRLFGIVYGEHFSRHQAEEAEHLSQLYAVTKDINFQELLFCVHTYFALLMKLIAAELITLKETSFDSSLSTELTHRSKDELKAELTHIEDGGIYAKRGITNFLEGDFFRWYIDAFSPRLEDAIREMVRALSEFEPATTTIDPEATRDLLKRLYQYLVPQEVRHRLGEYYTPDWLAELVLDEVGYDGDTRKRLLDPACGSGTFLVLAIQRAKEHGRAQKESSLQIVKRILANIWGFDLNPLAVIASRTNYLFALGDLVDNLPHLEIPIYLADSVLTPTKTTGSLLGEYLEVATSVHRFRIPAIWVKAGGLLLARAAPVVEEMVKQDYSVSEAMSRFEKEGLVFPPHENVVSAFYDELLRLERQRKNGIWARFLKNAFAPIIAKRFDYVVGNPPWIRWGYLSQEYRRATLTLWQEYGLFSLSGHAARLGGGEKDFSMLFLYATADYYLANRAKMGFLITQEVFKSKGAGEGFRRFRLGDGEPLEVLKAHDLATVQPFEGAANKTAAIFLRKGRSTKYPVRYVLWTRKEGIGKIPTDSLFSDVLPLLQRSRLSAQPIGGPTGSWQTTSEAQKHLVKIHGANPYRARRGASTEPYGVFWLGVKEVLSDKNLIIVNLSSKGKWSIPEVKETIESDLVFPAASGADIERWRVVPSDYVLITQDPETRVGYPEQVFKSRWPRTYGYLLRFRQELLRRAAYRKYHADAGHPFYSQYNVAGYTFARYKVIWKRMANDLVAAVISQRRTPFGYKAIVPTDTTSLFPVDDEDEAHFLCAIINSCSVREFVRSYSSAGRGFGAPSVMRHVGIPKFDPRNTLHEKLAVLSKTLHTRKANGNTDDIQRLERRVDKSIHKLFGIDA